MRRVNIRDIEGKPALCFDTGLDSRSFAQAKIAQRFAELGYIAYPDGTIELWKASGIIELDDSMIMWGPPFKGENLETLVEEGNGAALRAVVSFIRSKLFLGETQASSDPNKAFIACSDEGESTHPKGCVFFAPETLSARCLLAEGIKDSLYACPYLQDAQAAAFSAGALLYKILAGTRPFSGENFLEDMKEGFFLPVRFAASGLDEKLSSLIQDALLLPAGKGTETDGDSILSGLLETLTRGGNEAEAAFFFKPLTDEENALLAAEKERFIKRKNVTVKTNRFVTRNKTALLGTAAALIAVFFIARSMIANRASLPTTKGMAPVEVIDGYYKAFGTLDHTFMEACVKGADKSDVSMVINLFVINKVRQAYSSNFSSAIVSA
ncbi:MAG: hypothetical protein LBU82_00390, partial [Treponema sp.]|nr:hypothetical protein [Treponema sp.]